MHPEHDPITVVLATDSCRVGDGLATFLDDVPDITLTGRTAHLDGVRDLVDELEPQYVILGILSPAVTAGAVIAMAHELREQRPDVGVVVMSDRAQEFAVELLRRGSAGVAFLLDGTLPGFATVVNTLRGLRRSQSELGPGIVRTLVPRSDTPGIEDLNPRETDILERMAHGRSNRAIADDLHMSVKSIEKGITAIFSKLGPYDQGIEDRRVSASLAYLRTRADPFGPIPRPRERTGPPGRR
ncbi:MAG TPA: response regulator transcription factor [Acidimicrobiales bacterium]|nr:response regulator transcription factor [Acidimicrobiales bacterium]HVB94328.1 response regulator transcription factor [Acidimicrobiales bacterium]